MIEKEGKNKATTSVLTGNTPPLCRELHELLCRVRPVQLLSSESTVFVALLLSLLLFLFICHTIQPIVNSQLLLENACSSAKGGDT